MKRALTGIALGTLVTLIVAGSAAAASGQVTQFRFNGAFAEAEWLLNTPNGFIDTFVNASTGKQGSELFVDRFKAILDSRGNFLGGTEIMADVTTGFSVSIESAKLSMATMSAAGVPATKCRYDADFNIIRCTDVTLDMAASWTGMGPIAKSVFNDHFKLDGFSVNDHFNGTDRDARATGVIDGHELPKGDLVGADLGKAHSGTVKVCVGNEC